MTNKTCDVCGKPKCYDAIHTHGMQSSKHCHGKDSGCRDIFAHGNCTPKDDSKEQSTPATIVIGMGVVQQKMRVGDYASMYINDKEQVMIRLAEAIDVDRLSFSGKPSDDNVTLYSDPESAKKHFPAFKEPPEKLFSEEHTTQPYPQATETNSIITPPSKPEGQGWEVEFRKDLEEEIRKIIVTAREYPKSKHIGGGLMLSLEEYITTLLAEREQKAQEAYERWHSVAITMEKQARKEERERCSGALLCREDIDGGVCDCCQANFDAIRDLE